MTPPTPEWSPDEDRIVRAYGHRGRAIAARALLRAAGHERTLDEITTRADQLAPRLTGTQRAALQDLYDATETDEAVLDLETTTYKTITLNTLERYGLARHLGAGLWRITLAGIAYHREGLLPAPRARRKSLAQRIYQHLTQHPGSTARDVENALDHVGLASQLTKLANRGLLHRERPRGAGPYRYYPPDTHATSA